MTSIDARIESLLDQLDNPGLTDREIDRIEKKLKVLRGQKQHESSDR